MEINTENIISHEDLKLILKNLKSEKKKLSKKLEKQEVELLDASDWKHLKEVGDSILAVQHEIKKGMKEHIIFNQYTQKEEIIKLNPKCNAVKNADLYFKKASKGKRGHEICEDKVRETKGSISEVEKKIENLKNVLGLEENSEEYLKAIKAFENLKEHTSNQNGDDSKKKDKAPKYPYRHYTIDGYDIFLGKNSTQNDEISTRFAKPWDIWLHVAAHAGSHCVIRMQKNAQNPPKHVIEAAAAFSVYYSNAKNTSYADVHVTEGRFVRKRRKAPPGEVIAERCKIVRVAPINPHEYFKKI